jgi:hypothetical protein
VVAGEDVVERDFGIVSMMKETMIDGKWIINRYEGDDRYREDRCTDDKKN